MDAARPSAMKTVIADYRSLISVFVNNNRQIQNFMSNQSGGGTARSCYIPPIRRIPASCA
jgi:hypothetical protein